MARQFLVESLVQVAAGAALGVVVALVGLDLLLALAPGDIPRLSNVGVNLRVLGVTLAVTAAVGVAFGMIPMLQSRRLDLQAALKGRSSTDAHGGRDGGRLRSALVVAELALAVVLTVGAGLLVKSFWQLYQVDPGFRAERVLKAEFSLPQSRYPADFSTWPDWPAHHRFVASLIREVSALPGVQSASVAASHPLASGFTNSFTVVGREAEAEDWPEIALRQVAPGYFRTMDVPVAQGRGFLDSDDAAAPRVMIVNAAAVRRFFPRGDAVGSRIRLYGLEWSIVGVVGDERFHGVAAEAPPAVYVSMGQAPITGAGSLLVRTGGDPAALARSVAAVMRRIDPGLAVFGLEPLDATLSQSLGQRRFTMLLLASFAGVAVLLAVVGVYGVLGYLVARRTPELGIRRALGAPQREVVGLVARQALVLAAAGIALGLVGAVAATRLMRGLVWGVSVADPLTYAAVAIALAAAAALASWLPALRAARVDPMVALRAE
jgi:predicted permease